jgi:hypothetical protein
VSAQLPVHLSAQHERLSRNLATTGSKFANSRFANSSRVADGGAARCRATSGPAIKTDAGQSGAVRPPSAWYPELKPKNDLCSCRAGRAQCHPAKLAGVRRVQPPRILDQIDDL